MKLSPLINSNNVNSKFDIKLNEPKRFNIELGNTNNNFTEYCCASSKEDALRQLRGRHGNNVTIHLVDVVDDITELLNMIR